MGDPHKKAEIKSGTTRLDRARFPSFTRQLQQQQTMISAAMISQTPLSLKRLPKQLFIPDPPLKDRGRYLRPLAISL